MVSSLYLFYMGLTGMFKYLHLHSNQLPMTVNVDRSRLVKQIEISGYYTALFEMSADGLSDLITMPDEEKIEIADRFIEEVKEKILSEYIG